MQMVATAECVFGSDEFQKPSQVPCGQPTYIHRADGEELMLGASGGDCSHVPEWIVSYVSWEREKVILFGYAGLGV